VFTEKIEKIAEQFSKSILRFKEEESHYDVLAHWRRGDILNLFCNKSSIDYQDYSGT
jgi:hypothetical protein